MNNKILLIIIMILLAIIFVFLIYMGLVYFTKKKKNKKIDNIFNPKNLIEEDSLMNVLDKKNNRDFKEEQKEEKRTFLNDNEAVKKATESLKKEEPNINPFNVDLTRKEEKKDIENSNNRFF